MPHAQLIIEVEQDLEKMTNTPKLKVEGCDVCLQQAITAFLLRNENFKNLINSSVRAANVERQKTQN